MKYYKYYGVVIGLCLFIVGVYITDGFLPINILDVSNTIINDWLLRATIRDVGLIVVVSIVVFSGMTKIFAGYKLIGIAWLIISISICVTNITLNYMGYIKVSTIYNDKFNNDYIDKIKHKLSDNGLTSSKRTELEIMLAEEYYLKKNVLVDIKSIDGNSIKFKPSSDLLKLKDQYDKSTYLLKWLVNRTKFSILLWTLVPVISGMIGAILRSRRGQEGVKKFVKSGVE